MGYIEVGVLIARIDRYDRPQPQTTEWYLVEADSMGEVEERVKQELAGYSYTDLEIVSLSCENADEVVPCNTPLEAAWYRVGVQFVEWRECCYKELYSKSLYVEATDIKAAIDNTEAYLDANGNDDYVITEVKESNILEIYPKKKW